MLWRRYKCRAATLKPPQKLLPPQMLPLLPQLLPHPLPLLPHPQPRSNLYQEQPAMSSNGAWRVFSL
jgi:hypothetical protein